MTIRLYCHGEQVKNRSTVFEVLSFHCILPRLLRYSGAGASVGLRNRVGALPVDTPHVFMLW